VCVCVVCIAVQTIQRSQKPPTSIMHSSTVLNYRLNPTAAVSPKIQTECFKKNVKNETFLES